MIICYLNDFIRHLLAKIANFNDFEKIIITYSKRKIIDGFITDLG